jgi:uncharacterized protein (TIGR02246 family)
MIRTIAAAVFAAGFVLAPMQADADPALAQPSQDWAREWQAKRLDAVLALYTPDAVFMDADGSRVAGLPALKPFFATVLAQYSAKPRVHSVENSASGDLAYDWGDYSEVVTPMGKSGAAIETRGTYLVILKRVQGKWKIAEQMWTGNVPVPVKR